jgi:hypothetical protein
VVVLANLVLVFAVFIGANLSLAWGEVGSYPLHADKSSLAGFGAVVLLMPARWTALAFVLVFGVVRGGFDPLPGSTRWQAAQVLTGHLLLGILSYRAFEWMVAAIQRDDPGPQRFAWVFGLVLPLAVTLIGFWGVNRRWIPRHGVIALIAAGAIVAAHVAGWRAGYRR